MAESSPNEYKTLWEKEKCSLEAISPFPMVFSKDFYCQHVKKKGFVWEWVYYFFFV